MKPPRPSRAALDAHADARTAYRLQVSEGGIDEEWDQFLARTAGGHHLQSSAWGQTKADLGWSVTRLTAARGGHIRGGLQLLVKAMPLVGRIGYVAAGPVLDHPDPVQCRMLVEHLHRVARQQRLRSVVVQPPAHHAELIVPALRAYGFTEAKGIVKPYPAATLLIDLNQDDEQLLASMRKATRYNIRRAQRDGVSVRMGDASDVPVFHRLLTLTGERQGFAVPPSDYFQTLLQTVGRTGDARIFIAEHDGAALSAALVIGFGSLASLKRAAWSGSRRTVHPNELLQWAILRWAKANGYRTYDMEGVDGASATTPRKDDAGVAADSVTAFKLGFGGDVTLSPCAYQRIGNPLLRWMQEPLAQHVVGSKAGRWLVERMRTR